MKRLGRKQAAKKRPPAPSLSLFSLSLFLHLYELIQALKKEGNKRRNVIGRLAAAAALVFVHSGRLRAEERRRSSSRREERGPRAPTMKERISLPVNIPPSEESNGERGEEEEAEK